MNRRLVKTGILVIWQDCQQQQTEIGGLRDCVNEMTGAVKLLERSLNKLLMRVKL